MKTVGAQALASVCADPRHLGAEIGALAVLHTWTRALEWHPHVHMLVPGGGLAPDGRTWRSARRRAREGHKRPKDYLVPERAVASRFRGRFLELARRALPDAAFPHIPWGMNWIVHIEGPKPHARPEALLDYLGRYVHRTAITDRRITACDERAVTFTYRDSRDGRQKVMTLPPDEFLRRFLQHVPSHGFHRVRAYGLLHPKHRTTLRRLQLLLTRPPPDPPAPDRETEPGPGDALAVRAHSCCPSCKTGTLRLVARLSAAQCRAWAVGHPRHDRPTHRVRAPP
ncbi:MAG: transposase [Polyangiaceae bacterium]|nr:transposase [Polyangiaceae bacterium]